MLTVALLAATLLTNAAEIASAISDGRAKVRFQLDCCTLTMPYSSNCCTFAVEDASGGAILRNEDATTWLKVFFRSGDRLGIRGMTSPGEFGHARAHAHYFTFLSHGPAPVPQNATIEDLMSGACDNRLIRLRGTVRDAFRDEIDPIWIYFILNCDGIHLPIVFPSRNRDPAEFRSLTDAEVAVTGVCQPNNDGIRRMTGRILQIADPSAVEIIRPAPEDPFAVPEIDNTTRVSPQEINRMGRRRLAGTVIAIPGDRTFVVRDRTGGVHRVELAEAGTPDFGNDVETVGFPETDLLNVNLTWANWRPAKVPQPAPEDETVDVSPEFIRRCRATNRAQLAACHGRRIRFRGTVQGLKVGSGRFRTCTVTDGDFSVVVNSGPVCGFPDDLSVGSRIEATGTCIVSASPWRSSATFPHIEDGFTLVLRMPGDLRITAHPPWWTPFRLMIIIAVLVLLLAAILVWNAALKTLAERRGRQLFRAEIGKAEATLRIGERTRLAVELHDSISQNLTGAAFQIDAARDATPAGSEASRYLACAKQILQSCRAELRRCIWDLRSNALEAPDMNTAILTTVRPVAASANVHVHFNVARSRISDTSAHALLRIIRELVSNSVRHGQADRIRIAGEIAGENLHFSVADNGCGFDPNDCPGPSDGHFGLAGIRERIDEFGGSMVQSRSAEGGVRTEITIQMHSKEEENA